MSFQTQQTSEIFTNAFVTDNGNSGASITINFTKSNYQKVTLTANCTFTFTYPSLPTTIYLKVVQDGTGSRTVTWPATVKWNGSAPTLSTAANAVDNFYFVFDGTNAYGAMVGLTGSSSSGWGTTGNSGLTAGTNFIGTTDAVDVVFKRNSAEIARLLTDTSTLNTASLGSGLELTDQSGNAIVAIISKNATTANAGSDGIWINVGSSNGTGAGGDIQLNAGNGGTTGFAGSVGITGGQGGTTSGAGGDVSITGGSPTSGNAGNVSITATLGAGGTDGKINISASSILLTAIGTESGALQFSNTTSASVTTPTAGMVIFDTGLNKLKVYTGAAWQTITSV